MQKIIKFLEDVEKQSNSVLIFHNDADGISSATMLKKYLEKKSDVHLISQPMPTDENLIQKIKTTVPDYIVFTDLAIDQQMNNIEKIKPIAKTAVIDHHQIKNDLNKIGIVHYNPRFEKDVYQSAAYLTYKICSPLNVKNILWVAGIGITADYDTSDSQDIIKEIKKKYNIKSSLYDSQFGLAVEMISAARATGKLSSEEIASIVGNSEGLEDFLKNRELMRNYELIENEKAGLMIDFKTNAEIDKNYVFYELKTKHNLKSPIATKISEDYPEKIVVIYQKKGNKMKLSCRNQTNKFNVGKLVEMASKGLKVEGGGHKNAAGANVHVDDWEKFKEKLKNLVD